MTQILFSTDYFGLEKDNEGITFIRSGDAVVVVPICDSGQVLLVKEYAPALGSEVLVLPGGEVENGEAHVETANRELQEELGYRAGRMEFIAEIRPWAKYLTVRDHVYLARNLTPSKLAGDEAHPISVQPVTWDDISRLVADYKLQDAVTIAALYLARAYFS